MRLLRRTPKIRRRLSKKARSADTIQRFVGAEIQLHWAIALPFLVCYLSAVILVVVYNPSPLQPLRPVFSWIHRVSGVCLAAGPLLVAARNRAQWKLYLDNFKQGWVWTLDDVRWLLRSGAAAMGRKVSLPDQGKFNAGEKLNFMMVSTTWPLFLGTGVLIWLPGVSFYAWLAHVFMAAIATPLVAGHIFMATINPETRKGLQGMVTGSVDRHWAEHHYTRWYRERFSTSPDDRDEDCSQEASPPVVESALVDSAPNRQTLPTVEEPTEQPTEKPTVGVSSRDVQARRSHPEEEVDLEAKCWVS